MMRLRKPLLIFLFGVVIPIVAAELALRLTDPSGGYGFVLDLDTLWSISVPQLDGLRYVPGHYPMQTYTLDVDADGFRYVPDSRAEKCRIAFVGDSMTMGMGSDLSFVDILAPGIPATVINAGFAGYSVENIQRELITIPADGYVWLVFKNDAEHMEKWQYFPPRARFALEVYFKLGSVVQPVFEEQYFRDTAREIIGRADVLAFAYEGTPLTDIVRAMGAQIIPPHTLNASNYDSHPSEKGHAQLAASMKDDVIRFAEQRCLS